LRSSLHFCTSWVPSIVILIIWSILHIVHAFLTKFFWKIWVFPWNFCLF
jgi:hypothetical protein